MAARHRGRRLRPGQATAIALARLGRTARLDELDGPGANTLRAFAER